MEACGSGGVSEERNREEERATPVTRMGAGAFGYVPLAGVRRWTLLVTNRDE